MIHLSYSHHSGHEFRPFSHLTYLLFQYIATVKGINMPTSII